MGELFAPLVPYILTWYRDYKVKAWLRNDITSGITLAIVCIPQGLAYAKLAYVDTVYGKAVAKHTSAVLASSCSR
jgi:MFS superfamily sulfate permease-like transporter